MQQNKYDYHFIIKFIGLIIFFYILLNIDLGLLKNEILNSNPIFLFIAIVLNIPHLFIKSVRWNLLLKQQNIYYSSVQTFIIYMGSLYFGFITPGRLGEFVKAIYLKSDRGISISKGFSSVLMDRLCDLYLLMILGFLGIWKFDVIGELSNSFLVFTAIVIFAPLIILKKQLMKKLMSTIYKATVIKKVKGKIDERFEEFYCGLQNLINYKLIISGLITCLGYFIFFIQCYLIVMAMGLSIEFINITLFMAISNLISFIPVSISGLGTRDAILIYLFSRIGLQPELAVTYAFLVFITFFLAGGLFGAWAWWKYPVKLNI